MNEEVKQMLKRALIAAILLCSGGAQAALINYTILNISQEGANTSAVYAGTGYAGVYGNTVGAQFNGIFGLEYDFSRTLVQVDVSAISGATINSATLSFYLQNGNGNLAPVTVTRFAADGTLEYSFGSPGNLGTVAGQTAGPGANALTITSLVAAAATAGDDWLGLHLMTTSGAGNYQWTPANRSGNADAALVRLTVDYDPVPIPEPATILLVLTALVSMMALRRGAT